MTAQLKEQAMAAIGRVVERTCPLCEAELRVHAGRACCPCCGDSYLVRSNHLEVMECPAHGRHCEHWQAVWAARSTSLESP